MYNIEDLFDKRGVVGAKLDQILENKNCTKAELCKRSGVSRPTLDKLLAGTLTSKTNYEKHISKILDCLSITPDILLGNVCNEYNRTRAIRSMLRISSEEIAEATEIPLMRLKEIEAGEEATIAELRDIAFCLSVSVNCLMDKNFFEPQIATLDDFIRFSEQGMVEELSGFWGYVGILLSNTDVFLWFPITSGVRKMVYRMMNSERIVIPCMNNKLLFLNMQNVKEIILLDEACDSPEYVNWDEHVDCDKFPLVIYDALEDYIYCEEIGEDNGTLSLKFKEILDGLVRERGWTEDDLYDMTALSNIYYIDGEIRPVNIEFEQEETISSEISCVYDFGELADVENVLYCEDINGTEILINMKNVSMLELPLLKVEKAINENEL